MDGNGETTISYVKIWNHPIETTTYKWMFQVPGYSVFALYPSTLNLYGSRSSTHTFGTILMVSVKVNIRLPVVDSCLL